MSSVQNPNTEFRRSTAPIKTNRSASEIPETISGFVRGMLVTDITSRRVRCRIAWMPSAAVVPKKVAIRLESTAMTTELRSRGRSVRSLNSSAYWCRVKPSKEVISFPVLNDATISTRIGAYKNRKIRTV